MPGDVIHHLLHAYGRNYTKVAAILDETPSLAERLAPELPYVKAEIVHAVRNEMALTLIDVLNRRTHLLMEERNQGLDQASEAARLAGRELGWSDDEQQRQIALYRAEVARTRAHRQ